MVGGAMFSAPMVDEVGERLGADAGRKTFVNYWFRHVWQPVLPLYPSILLATELLGLTTTQLAEVTWPLTVAAVAGGVIFGVLGLQGCDSTNPAQASRLQDVRTLAESVWPVVLVVVLSLALTRFDERASLLIGLVVTVAAMMLAKSVPLRELGTILRERIPWNTVVVIFGALIFRRVLEYSGAVAAISGGLTGLRIPLALVAFAVPFIAGLLTGLEVAAFGISFPVVLPLVTVDGGSAAPGWAAWMLAAGFLGTMCSPVHLCLALTRVYFKAQWGSIYRRIVPSAFLMVAVATVILILG